MFNTLVMFISKCGVAVSLIALVMLFMPILGNNMTLLLIVIGALFLLNILMCVVFYKDKSSAKKEAQRVSEKTLILLSALALHSTTHLVMHFTRHKTNKVSFQVKLLMAIAIQFTLSVIGFVHMYV
ncbi:DUF1294 domain-containing protein [Pseudoalteromonas luteoviolacea]|nr:DUF1294 domain-containing protein [Pseudoalteromonas luteoviolacea]MBQ4878366.1 DUF1294 domain-containing protein [Pseudoalteromonas luteoviolacea]MBQ4907521.1 DUF1294 domain-containing protein [Pseudoalteromonas luteoviolacea]